MRQYIDLLKETPIQDFEFIGDRNQAGTFEPSDLKTISHPTWESRLIKTFSGTKEPINIYVINYNSDYVYEPLSDASIRPPHSLEDFRPWDKLISGHYTADLFKSQFGFLPPNYENSITLVLTHNFGDDKIPLTPWMVVHRMMHAFNHQSNDHWRKSSADSLPLMNLAIRSIYNMIEELIPVRLNGAYLSDDVTELAKACSNLKSARNGITRVGELVLELVGQYFIRGLIYFDIDKTPKHLGQDLEEARRYLNQATSRLDEWRERLVGSMVVL